MTEEISNFNDSVNSTLSRVSEVASTTLKSDNSALTQELIHVNRETTKLKREVKVAADNSKKLEREKHELEKTLCVKNDIVNRLKNENEELSITLQTDQFKSVRIIEVNIYINIYIYINVE